jgi:pentose-5-phosphate-3-epimerase
METTMQDTDRVDGRQLPGFYVDSLTPLVHRRAAEAALRRDRRLELAIDADGGVQARMIEAHSAARPEPLAG